LNVTPDDVQDRLAGFVEVSLSLVPAEQLTPLNEASCDVVVICCRMLLYCVTRCRARLGREITTGADAVEKASAL